MKKTFWEFSKGKIVWYYLLVFAVAYFTGMLDNSDIDIFIGSIIGLILVPLVVLVVQWWTEGKTIKIGR